MLDPSVGWLTRGLAARVLSTADARYTRNRLLALFFSQIDKLDLWETALTLETLGDAAVVSRLTRALRDSNVHRRHAAARALGWIPRAGRRAATALIDVLQDPSQPEPVREEAAESLAYLGYSPAIPPLLGVLGDPNVSLRFWAVFALGGLGQTVKGDPAASAALIAALETMTSDGGVPPGNWWSVGREAQAALGNLAPNYWNAMQREITDLLSSPDTTPEDRRWAEDHGDF